MINDPIGQQVPIEYDDQPRHRIEQTVTALDRNRPAIERWFWKGLLAFNLLLGSLVFWGIVARTLA